MAAADRTRPAVPGGPAIPGGFAGRVHQATLERAFGRTFSVFAVFILLDFWFGSVTASGQSPGSAAASVLLSLLLIWQAARALRQPPSQRDLYLLAAGTAGLMLAIRLLVVLWLVVLSGLLVSAGIAWGWTLLPAAVAVLALSVWVFSTAAKGWPAVKV